MVRIERRSVNDPHESLHTTTASVARYASVRFCLTGAGPVWTACCFLIVTTPIGRVVLPEGRRLAGIAFGPGARKDLEFTEATFQCACLTPRRRVGSPSCLAKGIPPLCPVGLDVAHRPVSASRRGDRNGNMPGFLPPFGMYRHLLHPRLHANVSGDRSGVGDVP